MPDSPSGASQAQHISGRAVAAIGLALFALVVLANCETDVPFEDHLIFFPSRDMVATPAARGLPYSDVRFGPEEALHGWFIPGSNQATLLWFHGNAGNISYRVELLSRLHRGLGASIFIFDYQGYGLSRGRASEKATYQDAHAALAYLRARADVDPSRIVYFGKSLGAAVAVALAAEEPPYRLIAQSSFTSVLDMAKLHYPFLPIGPLLRTRYASLEAIANVQAPILVVHGDRDDVAPLEHARRLYAAAAEPKRLFMVEGAGHNDVITVGGQRYLDVLREFIEAEEATTAR